MKNWLVIGCVAFGLAGCYTPQDRAAGGALLGGGVGSAVGAAATGTWGGALLGGAVGAASGAIIGAATAPPECRRYRYRGRWYEECD
jgi:osmotically inducible lipoprotein OsmB